MTDRQKTHHRPGPSLQSTQGIDSTKLVSGKRTPNRWCGCGVRASMFPVPDDLPHHARRSPAHRSPRSILFPLISCNVNPGTTDARLPGQGRHGGRSQDTDAGDAMVRQGGRANRPPYHQRIPDPPGFGFAEDFGEDCRCFRARNFAFRANSAIRINSASRCFCNGVSASRTSFRS